MKHTKERDRLRISYVALCVAGGILALAAAGCNAKPSRTAADQRAAEPSTVSKKRGNTATAQTSTDPGINLQCVMDHIQNPPESFHYTYKKDGSVHLLQEADITPQTIDGHSTSEGFQRNIHGERSDPQSWQGGWSGLMGLSGMSSTIALIHSSSALKREGAGGPVNGYETIKYSIDTARGDTTEQGLYRAVLGPGGFEKGEAWVTAQGCPVKLNLDSELHKNDGSLIETIRYEEAMAKK